MKKAWTKLAQLLKNPKVVMGSMFLGVVVGIYFKDFSASIAPVGDLYMKLLGMCITPLLIVSISSSIAGLIKNRKLSGQLQKIFLLFPLGMIVAVAVGIALGFLGEPGRNLSLEAKDAIGKLMLSSGEQLVGLGGESSGILSMFKMMIPDNIFSALTKGNNLAILFFSIILGLSLGRTSHKRAGETVHFLEVMYEAFTNMIEGIMYGLPLGLFCLFADHISHVGFGIVFAIGKLIVFSAIGCLIISAIAVLVVKKKLKLSWMELYRFFKEPSVVAIATSSSFASIPAILNSFEKQAGLSKESIHLFVPLSVCLCAIGSSFSISLIAMYMMDLYGVAFSMSNLVIILFGSVATAIAMSGAPGVSSLAMLGIVTGPLGLPLEPTVLITMATMPLLESFITLSNVTANMAMVSVVGESSSLESNVGAQELSLLATQDEFEFELALN